MSFSLVVKFTGICTLVPNHDNSKYYVVLPDGDLDDHVVSRGADLKKLNRHRAFVRFRLRDLALPDGGPDLDDSVKGILYFKRRIEEGGSANERGCDLSFCCRGAAGPLDVGDLSHVAQLENFAPDFCTIDPLIVTGPVPQRVVGRVLIDKGDLTEGGEPRDWIFLNTLNPGVPLPDPRLNPQLTDQVLWQVDGLESLELAMTPFGNGMRRILEFKAEDDEIVEITVANLCDDNPLQWGPVRPSLPDLDFRWHYELLALDKYQELTNLLDGRDLPFPLLRPAGGVGMNCLSSRVKSPIDF